MFPCFVVFFYLKITRGDRWVFPLTEGKTEACKGERIFPKTVVEGKTPSSDSGLCDSSRCPPHEAQGRFWAEGSGSAKAWTKAWASHPRCPLFLAHVTEQPQDLQAHIRPSLLKMEKPGPGGVRRFPDCSHPWRIFPVLGVLDNPGDITQRTMTLHQCPTITTWGVTGEAILSPEAILYNHQHITGHIPAFNMSSNPLYPREEAWPR